MLALVSRKCLDNKVLVFMQKDRKKMTINVVKMILELFEWNHQGHSTRVYIAA